MLKDAILISVIFTLLNRVISMSDTMLSVILKALDRGWSFDDVYMAVNATLVFVSVIISKLLLFGLKKLF